MAAASDAPVDLYIAVYADPDAARDDWDAIKQLAEDGEIKIDGLVLLSRKIDGKIHVDDDTHSTRKGLGWGVVGGLVVGLIFPPSLLAGAVVGGGVGAGIGGLYSHAEKEEIKADVEDVLPLNSSAIVALFEEQWAPEVDKTLANAETVNKREVDRAERRAGQVRRRKQRHVVLEGRRGGSRGRESTRSRGRRGRAGLGERRARCPISRAGSVRRVGRLRGRRCRARHRPRSSSPRS